ncbi:hypothetical protein H114_18296 [Streptomyces gancidicus BKS 13-15]|uniref:Secreted protein n=1 Tax=Streptomyces gancidicus BKS 13-15 TaxID=1284664 RepID=M3CU64_STREZ|nr:hypothetical protein [Streptomyces gancidicus]EMF27628.1 hypothetical protein H114_18296 [Streptomyces gancidicus BKS 13-15]
MHHFKDGVRRLTAAAAALTATLALVVWAASPASAGGPTSVLVVSPESQETASAYCTDTAYSELERLLGPVGRGSRERPPEAVSASARQFNVTWLVHDVTPWRVDRVFMADAGQDAWIHTAERFNESPNGLWHRAQDPAHLYKLLYSLGVMGERTSAVPAPGIHPAPWETEQAASGEDRAADAAVSKTRAVAATDDDGTDWWWAAPGLAAGAVLALVLRPYALRGAAAVRDRRNRGDDGPRQQLLDI